jgi:large subunit ribosomal protein L21
MKYAVIRTGGKQYRINEGDIIDVERLADAGNKAVTFEEVLMVAADGDISLGSPLVSGVTVRGTLIEDIRGEKIRVAKYKAKVRYRRVTGHRQALSRVKIDSIDLPGAKKADTTEKRSAEVAEKKSVASAGAKKATVRTGKALEKTS